MRESLPIETFVRVAQQLQELGVSSNYVLLILLGRAVWVIWRSMEPGSRSMTAASVSISSPTSKPGVGERPWETPCGTAGMMVERRHHPESKSIGAEGLDRGKPDLSALCDPLNHRTCHLQRHRAASHRRRRRRPTRRRSSVFSPSGEVFPAWVTPQSAIKEL